MANGVPGRLRWRCRRGMRELDLLLTRWLDARWSGADEPTRLAFERLLERPDPDLAAWLLQGARPADPALGRLLDDILSGPR